MAVTTVTTVTAIAGSVDTNSESVTVSVTPTGRTITSVTGPSV